jgi:hypothetical protein
VEETRAGRRLILASPTCKHHYSKVEIMQLFNQTRGDVINCPAVGCKAKLQKQNLKVRSSQCTADLRETDIQPDKAFQAKADQHYLRETQRQEEDVEDFEDLTQEV